MVIHVSKIEEVMKAEELLFPPTPAFGRWKHLYPKEATSHPAKMNQHLLEFLINKCTKKGEVILDPMCGTASTCVMGSILGRNTVGVELEAKFVDMGLKAKKKVESALGEKGSIHIIQGDSRRLSELLSEADTVITSPPYAEQNKSPPSKGMVEWGLRERPKSVLISGQKGRMTYSDSKDNIGNLPSGNVDAVITSPPYSESLALGGEGPGATSKLKSTRKSSLANYSDSIENIGNLSEGKVDNIITSPPYADQEVGKAIRPNRWNKIKDLEGFKGRKVWKEGEPPHYSDSTENIGNLKQESYFEAMLKVYQESYKVLKPKGKIILVLKNFIRRKQVVDLVYDTYRLMLHVGFKLEKVYKLRLENPSFWRILYVKKYPTVPTIEHEYAVVFSKR